MLPCEHDHIGQGINGCEHEHVNDEYEHILNGACLECVISKKKTEGQPESHARIPNSQ